MSNTEAEHRKEEEAPAGEDEDTGAQVALIVKFEEVTVSTGEENEHAILDLKSKLYRFNKDGNQWKEQGAGTVKFLKHKETGKVCLLTRQSKTLKICANHLILPSMSVQEHFGNEKSCVWHARDFADGELKDELFCIRCILLSTETTMWDWAAKLWTSSGRRRGLSNLEWQVAFSKAKIKYLLVLKYDHAPFCLQLSPSIPPNLRSRHFQFNAAWLSHPDLDNLVTNLSDSNTSLNDFLSVSGIWNEKKLRESLPNEVDRRIMALAPPSPWKNNEDSSVAWARTTDSSFTVKTAYQSILDDHKPPDKIFKLIWNWHGPIIRDAFMKKRLFSTWLEIVPLLSRPGRKWKVDILHHNTQCVHMRVEGSESRPWLLTAVYGKP
ncbi:hypothetical protein Ahy_B03g067486 [Arachis hypogaea]|uniref:RanBD1 domain-containing protein n=2 Tax=Arachis hypogaea TaxID=3818 RepID=A0A445A6Y1_ARAHY|nr:hypothetical protein Ahy_B03g067486 [Arachis hypogaea]